MKVKTRGADEMKSMSGREHLAPPPAGAGYGRLLEAATIEFARLGQEGARVDTIAKLAGVNKQLVYHYFGSKRGLYVAVLQRAYIQYRGDEAAIGAAIAGVDAETGIRRLAAFLYGRGAEITSFGRLVQDVNFHGGQGLEELTGVREAYAVVIAAIRELLDRGIAEGRFRSDVDAAEFYISLTAVCSLRVSNAASMSYALGVDLLTEEGALRSRETGISHLICGLLR